jgi:tRNA threonylcarbamoyladenosine biosynthesis protein TsaB
VSALELLVFSQLNPSNVMALLDAGRGEVYAGFYDGQEVREELILVSEAVGVAEARKLRVVVAEKTLAEKFANAEMLAHPSSEVAARLGLQKLLAGDVIDVLALDANYVRKTEAEYLQRLKR